MKTSKQKIIDGTFRKDRDVPAVEPVVLVSVPPAPTYFNEHERTFYLNSCTELLNMGALTLAAVHNTIYHAPWYSMWFDSSDKIRAGEVYEISKTGWKQISVYVSIMEKATKMLQLFSSSHGLTPVNKSKVKGVERKKENKLDQLLNE